MKNERIIEISNTLKELGISPAINGYTYLRQAIELVMNKPDLLNRGITKILYPTIAQKYNTKSSCVERGIRFAVERCYDRGNIVLLEKLFQYSISAYRGNATNSEFIATVADYLMLKEKSNEQR